jgi:hypothetical protein
MDEHTNNQPSNQQTNKQTNKQTKTRERLYVYLLLLWKENGLKRKNNVIDDKMENQDKMDGKS